MAKSTRKWTEEELEILKQAENTISITAAASKLGLSYCTVKNKVEDIGLNLKKFRSPRPWTPEEIKFLKENFAKLSKEELQEKLDRPVGSIKNKFYILKKEKNKEEVKKTNIKKTLEKCEEIQGTGSGMAKNNIYKIFIRGDFIGKYIFKENYDHFLMFKKIGIVDDYFENFLKVDIWRNEVKIIE